MRTATYDEIQRGVCELVGWDADNLDAAQFRVIRGAVSQALGIAWNRFWWSDLVRIEERPYRQTYSATETYAAGDEVWLPGPRKYYQALQETTGNAPATLSGTTWTENSQYWAECQRAYSASDWSASETYAVGDLVIWAENGRPYQRIVAGSGEQPDDQTKWGALTEFNAYVDPLQPGYTPLGRIRAVYDRDPRKWPGAARLEWRNSNLGIEVETDQPTVWVEALLRPHRFVGDAYDSSAAYTATPASGLSGDTTVEDSMAGDTSGYGYAGIAALRARTRHRDRDMAYLLYVTTDGDGGQGWFRFDAASTDTDDGVDVLRPDDTSGANPGRWERIG